MQLIRPEYSTPTRINHAAFWCGVVALVLLSSGCVLQRVRVSGSAMDPTLKDGERVVATRVFRTLERGDIVGFRYPRNPEKSFVERIIGLPGERIEMTNGQVIINGQPLHESYVLAANRTSETWGPKRLLPVSTSSSSRKRLIDR